MRPEAIVVARKADARGIHGSVTAPVVEVGVPGWPSWLSRWRDYREVWTARRAARAAFALQPELVWERHSLYSDAGWKLHAQGIPWILEVNAPLVRERQRFEQLASPGWAGEWEREVLRAAPRIVAVSQWLCEWLRSEIGCKGEIQHLPNGVQPGSGDREGTRRRLGLQGKWVLGFLGSMKPWHGVQRLPALLDALPDAVGLCVGDGPEKPEHPRLFRIPQVPEEEVPHYVAAMDLGLAPYAPDAPPWFCPLKILAYRAQGTPVLAPNLGDCRLLVGDGGTIVAPDQWVDAIRAWRGRRTVPWVRSWEQVVGEVLGGRR